VNERVVVGVCNVAITWPIFSWIIQQIVELSELSWRGCCPHYSYAPLSHICIVL